MEKTVVDRLNLTELSKIKGNGKGQAMTLDLSKFSNVKVQVEVCLGRKDITIKELSDLQNSSVLKLDRELDEPVEVLVDGKTIAVGSLVAVGDHFGIHVSEIKE